MTSELAAGAAAPEAYALIVANGQALGVRASALVQVLSRPPSLTRMPRASQNLAGLIEFRGQAVPVVDLAHWSGAEPAAGEARYIAILRENQQLIGLLIDAVHGLTRFSADQVQRLHHDESPDEFFHSVARQSDAALLPLLDTARLMHQASAWSSGGGAPLQAGPDREGGGARAGGMSERYAVLRIGQGLYGLRAADLAEVLPRPTLQSVWGSGTELLGMLRWRERDVPLVNPLDLLGSAAVEGDAPWVAILGDDRHCVALPCHAMDQVRAFELGSVQPAAGGGLGGGVCDGLVLQGSEPAIHLVDTGALLAAFSVRTISAHQTGGARADAAQHNRVAQVVFQARGRYAAPIDQLQEIVPMAADMAPQIGADGRAGMFNWRGQAVPLFDLERCLWPNRARSAARSRRILISRVAGQLSGLLVGEVEVLIPPLAGVLTQMRLPSGECIELITVGRGAEQTSYGRLDLSRLQLPGASAA